MIRRFGWISAAIGLAALIVDVYRGPVSGEQLRLASIAEYWSELHRPSLIGLNSFTEKNISPGFWDSVVLPAVSVPAALFFIVLAFILFLGSIKGDGGGRGRGRRRMMFPK